MLASLVDAFRSSPKGLESGIPPTLAEWAPGEPANGTLASVVFSEQLDSVMAELIEPRSGTSSESFWLDAEVAKARFSSWYELFPRSASASPGRHGTFADVQRRLDDVEHMGFDVLYLPPIHPIGRDRPQGPRHGAAVARSGRPGQPLGHRRGEGGVTRRSIPSSARSTTFASLVADSRGPRDRHGARPGLPGLARSPLGQGTPGVVPASARRQHPLRREPAEALRGHLSRSTSTPADWQALWAGPRDVVRFWIDQGVKVFRVDNPHTKPFAFWEWLIACVHADASGGDLPRRRPSPGPR